MPQPHPGQEWKHGWIPITPAAAKSKNHGRKPGAGSLLARVLGEAAEVHNRMKAEDAKRDAKAKQTSTATPAIASKPAGKAPGPNSGNPSAPASKPAPKSTPKPKTTPKAGAKVGADSAGKPLRVGDEVRLTGGADQGKNGQVLSKGSRGTVRVRTADGREVDVHGMNIRNRTDHETSRQADAAIRRSTGRPDGKDTDSSGPTVKEIQDRARDAYNQLAKKPGDWVSVKRIRDKMGKDLPRRKVDEAFRSMNNQPDVGFVPEANQKTLTQADRDAAVNIGDQDKHLMSIWT